MTDISEQVIGAVVARVRSQVTGVSDRVYFDPPQKTVFPYIEFNFSYDALPVKGVDALNYTITFNAYAQRGAVGALLGATRLGQDIFDALNRHDLQLSQGDCYSCRYDNLSTAFEAEDGRTIVHTSRFKILTTN